MPGSPESDREAVIALLDELPLSKGVADQVERWHRENTPLGQWVFSRALYPWALISVNEQGRVITIDVNGAYLFRSYGGSDLSELGNLPALEEIHLGGSNQQLGATLPPEIGNLANLRVLDISDNRISGDFPKEMEKLVNLETLKIRGTKLTGCLPMFMENIERDFQTGEGHFEDLAFCEDRTEAELEALIALYNGTDGPGWADNANWLTDQPRADWTGITTDTYGRVTALDLSWAGLAGQIPESITELRELRSLQLSGNDLTGCLPGKLKNVAENDLAQVGLPDCRDAHAIEREAFVATLKAVAPPSLHQDIDRLAEDSLSGPRGLYWPSWLEVTTDGDGRLTGIELRGHDLEGRLPAELAQLKRLEFLIIDGEDITGPIPPEIGQLANLTELRLQIGLEGPLPTELGKLAALTKLTLCCGLTGPLPPELGNLARLEYLSVGQNALAGHIPPELGGLSRLEYLNLQNNRLTGPIPPELDGLSSLEILSLSHNDLTGPIPPELGGLAKATGIYLSDNPLTGQIPDGFANLTSLQSLNIRNTGIERCVPRTFGRVHRERLDDFGMEDWPAC